MARRVHRQRFPGPRRQTTWVAPADQSFVAVSTGATVIVASFDAQANGMLAPTVIRNRGVLGIKLSSYGADLDVTGAYGIGVVSDAAFTAGVASVQGPWTDANWGG